MTPAPAKAPAPSDGKYAGPGRAPAPLRRPAIGMEAEFALIVDGAQVRPEQLFRDPRDFLRGDYMHRVGTSYHLPNGGAVYFDTGVIEVATPVIEIARDCAARAGRSLWESILFLRQELDAWEQRAGRQTRLVGFSAHYNVSFDPGAVFPPEERTVERLAHLLAHILPAPVMLLAANKRSTGVGVRPRGARIEITVDFTPSAALMIATGAFVAAVARAVMAWPSYDLGMLERRGLPVIEGFALSPHTSRKGWLARHTGFPENPFLADPDAPRWNATQGLGGPSRGAMSLRRIAHAVYTAFRPALAEVAGPFTRRLIGNVLAGRAPSLLDLPDRPDAYEDVGRLCLWDNLFPEAMLARSRYERVLIRAISGRRLRLGRDLYTPRGLKGWSEVVFRRERDGATVTFSLDFLAERLGLWEATPQPAAARA